MNGETFQRVSHQLPGKHNIEDEIISPSNDMFILHDSEGFERLRGEKSNAVHEFIERRLDKRELRDQLHAIWYEPFLSDSFRQSFPDLSSVNITCRKAMLIFVCSKSL